MMLVFMLMLAASFAGDATSQDTEPYNVDSQLMPGTRFCGRSGLIWLCDPKNVLLPKEATALSHHGDRFRALTPCLCSAAECVRSRPRVVMSVALLPITRDTDLQRAARELQTHVWDFGRCDDDVVLVLSTQLKKMEISFGDAVKKKIGSNEDVCKKSLKALINRFLVKKQFYLSTVIIIHRLREILNGKRECNIEKKVTYSKQVATGHEQTSSSKPSVNMDYAVQKEGFFKKMAVEFPRIILPCLMACFIAIVIFCVDWKRCYRRFVLKQKETIYW